VSAPIFEPIAQSILGQINAWGGIAATVATWVAAPILIGVTIMIIWHGLNLMRGAGGHHHVLDVFAKTLRAFLVVSLALAGGAYSSNVVGFISDLRTDLANLFVAAPAGASSYAVLDISVGRAVDTMRSMLPWVFDNTSLLPLNLTGLIGLFSMAFMVGCIVVYATVAAVNLLLIDFALAIIFAVGPLFVACFAFESTAKFFDAWLGGALKYTFTAVVMAAVLGIGNGILDNFSARIASSPDTIDFIGTAFAALAATGILIVMAFRAPEIAGNIVGGIGISVLGPAAASAPLAAIGSAMKGGARGAANATSYAAGAASTTAPGQRVAQAAAAIRESSVGQRVASAARFTQATGNMQPGSVGGAFNAGAGRSAGTGTITNGRPLTPPT
jgi:type IV secretion system protein VirB6